VAKFVTGNQPATRIDLLTGVRSAVQVDEMGIGKRPLPIGDEKKEWILSKNLKKLVRRK
jgi:hypothetical protein